MRIINVVGARPNFMKMAPIIEAMNQYPDQLEHVLVHTGQHYDAKMSKAFFNDLGMHKPDIDLGVGSGSHAEQTARVMVAFEKVCLEYAPDLVIVVGDVNSTMACAITAKKLGIRVAHVEAGLRSHDMTMPEEINRRCTDALCDLLFTTDHLADANLRKEGVPKEKIHFVGNVMIDTLLKHKALAEHLTILQDLGLPIRGYAILTLHRPSNVDNPQTFKAVMGAIETFAKELPVVFPVHPRTLKQLHATGLTKKKKNAIIFTDPMGYLQFLNLTMNARLVFTDSGGLQEETTVLGVPCITLRANTERPITCKIGTNTLVGNDPEAILCTAKNVLSGRFQDGDVPEKWDGHAAQRIVDVLLESSHSTE